MAKKLTAAKPADVLSNADSFLQLHTPGHQISFEEVAFEDDDLMDDNGDSNYFEIMQSKSRKAKNGHSQRNPPHLPPQTKPPKGKLMSHLSTQTASLLDEEPDPVINSELQGFNRFVEVDDEIQDDSDGPSLTYQKALGLQKLLFLRTCMRLLQSTWRFLLPLSLFQMWDSQVSSVLIIEGFSSLFSYMLLDYYPNYILKLAAADALLSGVMVMSISDAVSALVIWKMDQSETDSESLWSSENLRYFLPLVFLRIMSSMGSVLQTWSVDLLASKLPTSQASKVDTVFTKIDDWLPIITPLLLGLMTLVGTHLLIIGILIMILVMALSQIFVVYTGYDELIAQNQVFEDPSLAKQWHFFYQLKKMWDDPADIQFAWLIATEGLLCITFLSFSHPVFVFHLAQLGFSSSTIGVMLGLGICASHMGRLFYPALLSEGTLDRPFATTVFLVISKVFLVSALSGFFIDQKREIFFMMSMVPLAFSLGAVFESVRRYILILFDPDQKECLMRMQAWAKRTSYVLTFVFVGPLMVYASFLWVMVACVLIQMTACALYMRWMTWSAHSCAA